VAFALVIEIKSRITLELQEQAAVMAEYCWKRWFFGQPIGSRCSSGTLGVVRMPLGRNTGRVLFGTAWLPTVPAVVVLSSLLVAQNVPLKFPPAASVRQCSNSAASAQCQTQRFDSDGLRWIAPAAAFVALLSAGMVNWNSVQQLLPTIQTKGLHFNRPPPTN
jgi:hypothetical protein